MSSQRPPIVPPKIASIRTPKLDGSKPVATSSSSTTTESSNINEIAESFSAALVPLIRSAIIQPIVDGLANNGVTVTVDQLEGYCRLPVVPTVSTSAPMGVGGVATTTSASKGRGRGKKQPVPQGLTCQHIFKKGARDGQPCDKQRTANSEYCSVHTRQHALKKNTVPGTPFQDAEAPEAESKSVAVETCDNGFLFEPNNGFFLRSEGEGDDQDIYVVGRIAYSDDPNEDEGCCYPLSDDQKRIAKDMGFSIGEYDQSAYKSS